MSNIPGMQCIELITGANHYVMPKEKKPEAPENFIDRNVYYYRLVDGRKVFKGVALETGWENQRFNPNYEEGEKMPKKDIDHKAIVARAREVMDEQDISLYRASLVVAKETGLHRTTVYHHAKAAEQTPTPEPAAAANQEPEREEAEPVGNSVAPDLLFVNRHHAVAEEIARLLDRKRQDYGTGNIRKFGSYGVLVRVSDKIERLINLSKRDGSPNFESVDDTWKDIAGYAILALIELREGR